MREASNEDVAFALSTDEDILGPLVDYMQTHNLANPVDITEVLYGSEHGDLIDVVMQMKEHYDVPRPLKLAQMQGRRLPYEHVSWTIENGSYPSGHAASARYVAHLFSDMFLGYHPDGEHHRFELFNIANRIAWGRVILGVHSLQDIREGKRLADLYFRDV
jgi:hypothetical protein